MSSYLQQNRSDDVITAVELHFDFPQAANGLSALMTASLASACPSTVAWPGPEEQDARTMVDRTMRIALEFIMG